MYNKYNHIILRNLNGRTGLNNTEANRTECKRKANAPEFLSYLENAENMFQICE